MPVRIAASVPVPLSQLLSDPDAGGVGAVDVVSPNGAPVGTGEAAASSSEAPGAIPVDMGGEAGKQVGSRWPAPSPPPALQGQCSDPWLPPHPSRAAASQIARLLESTDGMRTIRNVAAAAQGRALQWQEGAFTRRLGACLAPE